MTTDMPLTPAQRAALDVVDGHGSSYMGKANRHRTNTVNASAARALVRAGVLERFVGSDGGSYVRRAAAPVVCYFREEGCTAGPGDHPKSDPTMYANCPIHSNPGTVLQHYNRTAGRYECWHCALDRFHRTPAVTA